MRDTFPPKAIGVSSALFAIALILGPALGPLAGGYLTDSFSWQWIFYVNLVPGTIAAIVVTTMLRDPVEPQRVSIDWLGLGLLALGLGALQILLDNGERNDWFNDTGMRCRDYRFPRSWLRVVAMERPTTTGGRSACLTLSQRLVGWLIGMTFGAIIFVPAIVTPLYTSLILSYMPFDSGLLLVMRATPVVLLTPIFATLAQRGVDVRYMLGSGFVLTVAALWWLNASITSATPFAALAWPLVRFGHRAIDAARAVDRWRAHNHARRAERQDLADHHAERATRWFNCKRDDDRRLRSPHIVPRDDPRGREQPPPTRSGRPRPDPSYDLAPRRPGLRTGLHHGLR